MVTAVAKKRPSKVKQRKAPSKHAGFHLKPDFEQISKALWLVLATYRSEDGSLTFSGFERFFQLYQWAAFGVREKSSVALRTNSAWKSLPAPITNENFRDFYALMISKSHGEFEPVSYSWYLAIALCDFTQIPPKFHLPRQIKPICPSTEMLYYQQISATRQRVETIIHQIYDMAVYRPDLHNRITIRRHASRIGADELDVIQSIMQRKALTMAPIQTRKRVNYGKSMEDLDEASSSSSSSTDTSAPVSARSEVEETPEEPLVFHENVDELPDGPDEPIAPIPVDFDDFGKLGVDIEQQEDDEEEDSEDDIEHENENEVIPCEEEAPQMEPLEVLPLEPIDDEMRSLDLGEVVEAKPTRTRTKSPKKLNSYEKTTLTTILRNQTPSKQVKYRSIADDASLSSDSISGPQNVVQVARHLRAQAAAAVEVDIKASHEYSMELIQKFHNKLKTINSQLDSIRQKGKQRNQGNMPNTASKSVPKTNQSILAVLPSNNMLRCHSNSSQTQTYSESTVILSHEESSLTSRGRSLSSCANDSFEGNNASIRNSCYQGQLHRPLTAPQRTNNNSNINTTTNNNNNNNNNNGHINNYRSIQNTSPVTITDSNKGSVSGNNNMSSTITSLIALTRPKSHSSLSPGSVTTARPRTSGGRLGMEESLGSSLFEGTSTATQTSQRVTNLTEDINEIKARLRVSSSIRPVPVVRRGTSMESFGMKSATKVSRESTMDPKLPITDSIQGNRVSVEFPKFPQRYNNSTLIQNKLEAAAINVKKMKQNYNNSRKGFQELMALCGKVVNDCYIADSG